MRNSSSFVSCTNGGMGEKPGHVRYRPGFPAAGGDRAANYRCWKPGLYLTLNILIVSVRKNVYSNRFKRTPIPSLKAF